jgi:signal transduction histidine kinase
VAGTAANLAAGRALPAAVALAAAAAAQALVGAAVLRNLSPRAADVLASPGRLVLAIAGTVVVANAITSPISAAVVAGELDAPLVEVAARWWAASALGTLLVLPAVLAWAAPRRPALPRGARAAEAAALGLALAATTALVFGLSPAPGDDDATLPYLVLAVLVWAALRFGVGGATLAILAVAVAAAIATANDTGPFTAATDVVAQVGHVQLFLAVATVTVLLLAVLAEQRARAEAELRRSNAELERHATIASHDLAVPLRTLEGMAGLAVDDLDEGDLDEARRSMAHVRDGAAELRTMVDELLTLSRAGPAALRREPVDVAGLARRTLESLAAETDLAGAEVRLGPLPVVVADPVQLARVLQNLVLNAVRHHRDGPARVSVSAEPTPHEWRIAVRDHGPGIPPGDAERIFEMDARGPDPRVGGLGSGLAICRRVVEAHGGRIWFEPADGGGSRFVFTLPAAVTGQVPHPPAYRPRPKVGT